MSRSHLRASGFTLIEVVVVLGIIVIIVGLGLANFQTTNNSSSTFSASRDMLTSDLRFAANKALNSERFQGEQPTGWGVQLTGGSNSYSIFADLNGNRMYDQKEKFKTVNLNQNIKIYPVYGTSITGSVVFNIGDSKTYFNNNQLAITPTSHLFIYLLNQDYATVKTLQVTPLGTVSY